MMPNAKHLTLGLIVVPLAFGHGTSASASVEQTFYCGAGDITYIFSTPFGGMVELEISISEMVDPALAGTFILEEVPDAGDVVLYTDGNYSVFERDTRYFVQEGDYDPFACESEAEIALYDDTVDYGEVYLPDMAAQSWGGNVRSGPGTGFAISGSLAEGTPVVLLENTGVDYNGYPWFEIAYEGGMGYHWGGIICGVDTLIEGTFELCN